MNIKMLGYVPAIIALLVFYIGATGFDVPLFGIGDFSWGNVLRRTVMLIFGVFISWLIVAGLQWASS